jgi:hypothetical protein
MDTLIIEKSNAVKAYNSADEATKKLLENLFGKENFAVAPKNIMERVRSFEDACEILGVVPNAVACTGEPEVLENDMPSILAYKKLIIIARALNEGWTPDWSNDNEYKYLPWFKHKSGFGLSYYVFDYWAAATVVGSRLCFKSSELATYAATQFADIYNDYLTIK